MFSEFAVENTIQKSAELIFATACATLKITDQMSQEENAMKKVKITIMRIACYKDLIAHACDMEVGQIFVANGWQKPE